MTLKDVIIAAEEIAGNNDDRKICQLVNQLEATIFSEIISPYKKCDPPAELHYKNDLESSLLLPSSQKSLYTDYICSRLFLEEGDFENSNAYSGLFNQHFSDLATQARRNNRPLKSKGIGGWQLQ